MIRIFPVGIFFFIILLILGHGQDFDFLCNDPNDIAQRYLESLSWGSYTFRYSITVLPAVILTISEIEKPCGSMTLEELRARI